VVLRTTHFTTSCVCYTNIASGNSRFTQFLCGFQELYREKLHKNSGLYAPNSPAGRYFCQKNGQPSNSGAPKTLARKHQARLPAQLTTVPDGIIDVRNDTL
jgi:hypothetical protein